MSIYPYIFSLALALAALGAIATRRDTRIVWTLVTGFTVSLSVVDFFALHNAVAGATFLAIAAIVGYQKRSAIVGDKKGQWRNWPWD